MTVSQTFLVYDDLDSFEANRSDILQTVPRIVLSDAFLMIRLGLGVFWKKPADIWCNFHHIIYMSHTINMSYYH